MDNFAMTHLFKNLFLRFIPEGFEDATGWHCGAFRVLSFGFLVFSISVFLCGCSSTHAQRPTPRAIIEPPLPFVAKTLKTEMLKTETQGGNSISLPPTTLTITLSAPADALIEESADLMTWQQSSAVNGQPFAPSAFKFYRATRQSGISKTNEVGNVTNIVVNVLPGETNRFYATAINEAGLESVPSNELLYTATNSSVGLVWDASPSPDVVGYRIYYGADDPLPFTISIVSEWNKP